MATDIVDTIDGIIHLAPWHKRVRWVWMRWRILRARSFLSRHDANYRMQTKVDRLLEERSRARMEGIGPDHPAYPMLDMEI
jgi:hypothetical protein